MMVFTALARTVKLDRGSHLQPALQLRFADKDIKKNDADREKLISTLEGGCQPFTRFCDEKIAYPFLLST